MLDRIKDLRIDNDLKQREVAEAIGITQRKYSYIERRIQEPGIDLIIALAEFYETSIDYLLGKTDVKEPYPRSRKRSPLLL